MRLSVGLWPRAAGRARGDGISDGMGAMVPHETIVHGQRRPNVGLRLGFDNCAFSPHRTKAVAMSLDSALFLAINGSAASPHWLTALALFATERLPLLLAGGTAGIFLAADRQVRLHVLQVLAAMATAWLLARLGQYFFPIDRPFVVGLGKQWLPHAASPGFPSSHSSVVFGFATAVALTAGRWYWASLALAAAVLVAWSRVYLGLHFPSDVLAGALVGAASAWVACRLLFRNPIRPAVATGLA